ncbi:membrane protein insertion efficiency factor YidD [Aldersonia sp. NBC_00410]|uniref:membrane protein insertion efficiency factor YidD n=1 Tax=Aldersonia sp. NBC_00410 TaxID=2975954 RepID=UPI00225674DF|nr:membrane protein insertion efficiency factor YidD [Aldersonia sp. NBC_00410]MCX5045011.1 membrane protein insertion efficiency factor YidD [Aldersonia sp. NBC_00410]
MSATSIAAAVRGLPARTVIFAIELYRNFVSPLRLPTCRFTPTCSEYAVTALHEWGLVRGLFLTTVRLVKCAPWHSGGWDPVPERVDRSQHRQSGASQNALGSCAHTGVNEQRRT